MARKPARRLRRTSSTTSPSATPIACARTDTYNAFAGTGIHGSLIDEAAGGSPALLRFVDFHTALATPRALQLAGVNGPRTFDEHAEVVCVDGVPTGELREMAAVSLVEGAAPAPTEGERYAMAAETLRRLA